MISTKRSGLTSRKGNVVIDVIVFVLVLVVVSMVTIFGWQAFTEVNDDIQADVTLNESKQAMQEVETRYPSVMDGLFMLIFLGMWAAGVVSALMSDQHPAIFGFMMLIIVFVIIAAAMFANYFEETYEDPELNTLVQDFPMTNWVMTHLLELTIVVALSIVLALMGKNRL